MYIGCLGRWYLTVHNPLLRATSLLIALAGFSSFDVIGAEDQVLSLSVNDPRPVAKAIRSLMSQYDYVITYEDPRYAYDGDIQDVTREVRKDIRTHESELAPMVLGPRGGSLTLNYTVSLDTREPNDPWALVQALLSAQAATGAGGIFRLQRTQDILHIVPARVRNSAGAWVDQSSILDATITVPEEDRTGIEMLEAICAALSEATGQRVEVGLVPVNLLLRYRTKEAANNETAQGVLMRVLGDMDRKLTWFIYYGPGTQRYTFNISLLDDPSRRSREVDVPAQSPVKTSPQGPAIKPDARQ